MARADCMARADPADFVGPTCTFAADPFNRSDPIDYADPIVCVETNDCAESTAPNASLDHVLHPPDRRGG